MVVFRTWLFVLLVLLVAPDFTDAAERGLFVEAEGPRPWYTMLRPARRDPAAQLAYARELRDRGSRWWARRHYRALIASWPSSPEASIAQLELAKMLEEAGAHEEAFAAYQHLMERYPGRFPFDEVYDRQLQIAEQMLTQRHFRFLFGGFTTPERAIPLLQKVAANAPSRETAGRAQLLLGNAYREMSEIESAIAAYSEIERRFAETPIGVEAAFRRAECLAEKSRRAPSDRQRLDDAWFAFHRFVRLFPESPFAAQAIEQRDSLQQARACAAWKEARFYEHRGLMGAAINAYERFLRDFSQSEKASDARARLEILRQQRENQRP